MTFGRLMRIAPVFLLVFDHLMMGLDLLVSPVPPAFDLVGLGLVLVDRACPKRSC